MRRFQRNRNRKTSRRIKVQTWYGMGGIGIIGPGFRHKSGVGRLIIPHPAVINWLLRLGLLENSSTALRINHEIGHLQSAPLAVLYTALNFTAIITANRATLSNLIIVFISTHAAWEIISEILTIVIDPQFYHKFSIFKYVYMISRFTTKTHEAAILTCVVELNEEEKWI